MMRAHYQLFIFYCIIIISVAASFLRFHLINIMKYFIFFVAILIQSFPNVVGQYTNNATGNYAYVDGGRAVSGNEFYGGAASQDFTVDSYAENNDAVAYLLQEATSGNNIGLGETRDSRFRVRNDANNNFALAYRDSTSGNRFRARNIETGYDNYCSYYNDYYYYYYYYYGYGCYSYGVDSGATVQQNAEDNVASSFGGNAVSGNQVSIDNVGGSEVNIQNNATNNDALTYYGDSTSGNVNDLGNVNDYGESYYSYYQDDDIILNNTANTNYAYSRYGTATSGNSNSIQTISGAGTEIVNNATGNTADAYYGGAAISGNQNTVGYANSGFNGEADIDLDNNAVNNNAFVGDGQAVAGNDNRVRGSFFSQGSTRGTARGNFASAYNGEAISGNRNYFVRTKTTDSIYTDAQENVAFAGSGSAVSGNDNVASDVFYGTDRIETNATDNQAYTYSGDAVSGNRNDFDRVLSGSDVYSEAQDNYAYSGSSGEAVSGNQLTIGNNRNNQFSGNQIALDANQNTAVAGQSDAVSGNSLSSDTGSGQVGLQATRNTARAQYGDAISGNSASLGRIGGR